eukprot:jgi/Chrzof1/654/Cz01g23270.t1
MQVHSLHHTAQNDSVTIWQATASDYVFLKLYRELHSRTMCMVHSMVWVVISRCCLPLLLALSTHTQPHFACPVPSVELPCLYIPQYGCSFVGDSSTTLTDDSCRCVSMSVT